MPRIAIILALLFLVASAAHAQTPAGKQGEAYLVPFASEGNRIELAVANTGERAADQVVVRATNAPAWLVLDHTELPIGALGEGEERLATFEFAAMKEAVVGEPASVQFDIMAGQTLLGSRTFTLQVEAPKEVALQANYPNPFNPTTTIGFDLPREGRADLRVYDVVGREVAVLAEGDRVAGHHEVKWEASRFASGLYFYILKAEDASGQLKVMKQKMLLVK